MAIGEPAAFGKYLLFERLAEGGMAVTWRAKLIGPGGFEKEFCVKQIREELAARPEFVELFVAEAKVTVSLTHANIVPVYELGMVENTYFLALELIDGPPLSKLIKLGPMPEPLAAYIVEQVLRGLDYAHRRGVVHRDLTPANVLVSRDGEVKIVDFGIATAGGGKAVQGGSRGYMAPEQEKGGAADARSDLYAVGVLLWELLEGRRWDGSPTMNETLQAIVNRATARSPEDRYPDAAAMLSQVGRFLRDLSMGPTQAELSEHVRKRMPDNARAKPGGPDPTKRSGPLTVPVEGRQKQVTFATRIQSADEKPRPGRPAWLLPVAAGVLLAAGGLAFVATRKPPVEPIPPPVIVTPPKEVVNPVPPKQVKLAVRSSPPGAEVKIGDRPAGVTPLDADVPVGPVAVHLRKKGFQPVDRTVDAQTTPVVDEKLQPLPKGMLTLNALPWAHVTIDGEKQRDTPLAKLPLPAGPHQVKLVCPPTGRELRFTVVVEPDKEVKKVADLRGEPKLISD